MKSQILNKTNNLRRWGLTWIVFGFLTLVTELFSIDHILWTIFGVLVMLLVSPASKPQGNWLRIIVEFIGALLLLGIAIVLITWLSMTFSFNPVHAFSAISLLIGIVLQIWGEMTEQYQTRQDALNAIAEKIKTV
jgi:hypothetical protein